MIRDLVEQNLFRLRLQTENHDEVVDLVTRVIGAAADDAVRDLLQRRPAPPAQPDADPDISPADDPDRALTGGGKRGKTAKFTK
jgi:hypothetical protein